MLQFLNRVDVCHGQRITCTWCIGNLPTYTGNKETAHVSCVYGINIEPLVYVPYNINPQYIHTPSKGPSYI